MIDVTQEIRDMDGLLIPLGKDDETGVLTLRVVCVQALTALYNDERIDGGEKLRRGILAERIHTDDEVGLRAEEISLIKRLVGVMYGPLVVMRVYRMLDPGEEGDHG